MIETGKRWYRKYPNVMLGLFGLCLALGPTYLVFNVSAMLAFFGFDTAVLRMDNAVPFLIVVIITGFATCIGCSLMLAAFIRAVEPRTEPEQVSGGQLNCEIGTRNLRSDAR